MSGYLNYYYKDGKNHTKGMLKEYKILTVHRVIIKKALTLMHKITYMPGLGLLPLLIYLNFKQSTILISTLHCSGVTLPVCTPT